jgi:hypothetical protein
MEKFEMLKSRMPRRLFSLIALLCLSAALHAQSEGPAHYQIYGGYAFLSNSFNGVPGSRQPLNGWDAAVAFPSWHRVRFKVDVASYRGTNLGAPQHAASIMGGVQYTWKFKRESVFVEGLGGDIGLNKNWGAAQAPGGTASFSTLAGGGLDSRLARHVAFRVSGGFQWSNFALIGPAPSLVPYRIAGLPTNFGRISTGIVWQF